MSIEELLSHISKLEQCIEHEKEVLAESERVCNVFLLHENTDPSKCYDGYNGSRHNNAFMVALNYKDEGLDIKADPLEDMKDVAAEIKELYISRLEAKIAEHEKELDKYRNLKFAIEDELNVLFEED